MQGVSCWFSIGLKLRIIHVNVGTHGSCIRSNNPAYMPSILLERMHEPCVPTCNLTHITMQYQPFHRMILPILHDEMGHFCALIGSFRTVKQRTLYQETAHLSSQPYRFYLVFVAKTTGILCLFAQLFGCQCVVKAARNARISVMVCFRFEYASYARLLVKEFHVMFRAILKGA